MRCRHCNEEGHDSIDERPGMYCDDCRHCDGNGSGYGSVCSSCNGTGKRAQDKDPSSEMATLRSDLALALHREKDGLRRIDSLAEGREKAWRERDWLRALLTETHAALRHLVNDADFESMRPLPEECVCGRDLGHGPLIEGECSYFKAQHTLSRVGNYLSGKKEGAC